MTVSELRRELMKHPADKEVKIESIDYDESGLFHDNIKEVSMRSLIPVSEEYLLLESCVDDTDRTAS